MATNVLRNNFTSGIVSQRLWGQYNSTYYTTGCANLKNFIIHPQGGIERRYPTTDVAQMNGKRIFPFLIDEHTAYMIEFYGGSQKYVRVWKQHDSEAPAIIKFNSVTGKESATGDITQVYDNNVHVNFNFYTELQIEDVQFTQGLNGSKLILVLAHKNHCPMYFEYDPTTDAISFPKQITHSTASFSQHPAEGSTPAYEYPETLSMFTTNDNPSVVYYYASRLWFASSINHPYRLWASRPFQPLNFQMVDYSEVVNDVTTSQNIIDAIEDEEQYSELIEVTYEEVIREDNALLLEVGSSNNDRIMWISSMGNYIIVGTSGSEWMMAGTINGLTQNAYQASAYGSSPVQPVMANNDLIFVQNGFRKLRAYMGSESGYSCPDLTFQCDTILSQGVKRMCFMRVPEPTLFCLLENGKLAVLFYDRTYSLQGWGMWELDKPVLDICVVTTNVGQRVCLVVERANNDIRLEYFDEGRTTYKDSPTHANKSFESALDTITYERTSTTDGSSLGKKKRIYEANLRTLNASKGSVGYYWGSGTSSIYTQNFSSQNNSWGIDDVKVSLGGGYEKYVSFKLRSIDDGPLTVDAISLFTEVE